MDEVDFEKLIVKLLAVDIAKGGFNALKMAMHDFTTQELEYLASFKDDLPVTNTARELMSERILLENSDNKNFGTNIYEQKKN